MDRPDSRSVLDNLIMVKQMDPKTIFLRLALDEGNADYLDDTRQKKRKERDEKEENDINLYTWSIFSVILFPTPLPFLNWTVYYSSCGFLKVANKSVQR
jgi:hypothetical protein